MYIHLWYCCCCCFSVLICSAIYFYINMNIFHMILVGEFQRIERNERGFRETLLCLFIEFTGIYKQNVSTWLPTICLSITINVYVCVYMFSDANQQKNCTEINMKTIKQIKKIYLQLQYFFYYIIFHPVPKEIIKFYKCLPTEQVN